MTTTDFRRSQLARDSHEELDAADPNLDVAHASVDSHASNGDIEQTPPPDHLLIDSQPDHSGLGDQVADDGHTPSSLQPVHKAADSHFRGGGLGAHLSTDSHVEPSLQPALVTSDRQPQVGGLDSEDASMRGAEATSHPVHPRTPSPHPELADPLLSFLGAIVDDLEDMRKANENRLRQLTRKEVDSDGQVRGFGLDETVPAVAKQIGIVAGLAKLERDAVKNLEDRMKDHPLAVFAEQRGVGLKSLARLLAVIGDPFWNTLAGEPRGLRQLWAYSGLHNVSVHGDHDSHEEIGRGQVGGDQGMHDSHGLFVAARRTRGQRANWSSTAKSRAYLIADPMLKSGNRAAYDARKALTEGKLHAAPCVQCGKKGKPAEIGTPWRDGHRHADAMRIVSKDHVLRPLWELARAVHTSAPPIHAADSHGSSGRAESSDSSTFHSDSHVAHGESDHSSAPPKGGLTSQNGFGGADQTPGLPTPLVNSHALAGEPGTYLPDPSKAVANSQIGFGGSGTPTTREIVR